VPGHAFVGGQVITHPHRDGSLSDVKVHRRDHDISGVNSNDTLFDLTDFPQLAEQAQTQFSS
jgi:hypothetical protein